MSLKSMKAEKITPVQNVAKVLLVLKNFVNIRICIKTMVIALFFVTNVVVDLDVKNM